MENFLNDIFGGQTGDKISHIKRKKNNKTTYVTLEGIEKSKHDVKQLSETAVDILYSLPGKNEFLEELIEMLVSREK